MAHPTSRVSDFPPKTTGMIFASHAAPCLRCADMRPVVQRRGSQTGAQDVPVDGDGEVWGSPAALGQSWAARASPQTSSSASALRCGAVRCVHREWRRWRVGVWRTGRSATGARHGALVRGISPARAARRGDPTTATLPRSGPVAARRGAPDRPGQGDPGCAGQSCAAMSS